MFTTLGSFQTDDVGRYVRFAGTGYPIDGKLFPIVAVPVDGGGTAVLATGTGLTLSLTAGTYTVFAGLGPTPRWALRVAWVRLASRRCAYLALRPR